MSCLDATFTLTPKHSVAPVGSGSGWAYLQCIGADFWSDPPLDFGSLYSTDRFRFDEPFASDPALDYTQWSTRRSAHFLGLGLGIAPGAFTGKQLILIFGFDTDFGGRVHVYSDAALLADQPLLSGENQFAIVIDALSIDLYFIHVGGSWFFKGISGYLV